MLGYILADTPSGRLYKALVQTNKATRVSAWPGQLHDPGLLVLTAEVRKDHPLDEVKDEMIRITEEAGASAPAAEDVERARQALLNDWDTTLRSSGRAAIRLSEWAAMGDWRLMFLYRDRLKEVTARDVQRVAATYLK